MGRPHAYPHQHLVVRYTHRTSAEQDSIRRDTIKIDQSLAKMASLVLYSHHEFMDGRQGGSSMGQDLWQVQLRRLVSLEYVPRLKFSR